MIEQPCAAATAGEVLAHGHPFRCAVHVSWPGVAEVFTLGVSCAHPLTKSHRNQMTLKEPLGFTVLSLLMPCLLLGLQAGCKTNPPTATELQRLQGYWESVPPAKNSITITGNSLHYYARTDFWYETTFTLTAGTDPQQLHATVKRCSYPDSIGKVVIALFKIEDGTLSLAYLQTGAAPKNFEDEEADRFKLRKVQPQKKNTEPPKSK